MACSPALAAAAWPSEIGRCLALRLADILSLQVAPRIQQFQHVLTVADAGGLGPRHAQPQDRQRWVLPDLGVRLAPAVADEQINGGLLERGTLVVADPRPRRPSPGHDRGGRLRQSAQRWGQAPPRLSGVAI